MKLSETVGSSKSDRFSGVYRTEDVEEILNRYYRDCYDFLKYGGDYIGASMLGEVPFPDFEKAKRNRDE